MNPIEVALRKALREMDRVNNVDAEVPIPQRRRTKRVVLVRFAVRDQSGGEVFRFDYHAPSGTWPMVAEAEAKKAVLHAGLSIHAHLETSEALIDY